MCIRDSPNANLTGGGSTLISDSQLTPAELKGLRAAGIFSLVYFGLLAFMTIPSGGLLRSPEGTILPVSYTHLDVYKRQMLITFVLFAARKNGYLYHFSTKMILAFFALNIVMQALERNAIRLFLRSMRSNGFNLKHILLIGYSRAAEGFVDRVCVCLLYTSCCGGSARATQTSRRFLTPRISASLIPPITPCCRPAGTAPFSWLRISRTRWK